MPGEKHHPILKRTVFIKRFQIRVQFPAAVGFKNHKRDFVPFQTDFIHGGHDIERFIAVFHGRAEPERKKFDQFRFRLFVAVTLYQRVHLGNHIFCVLIVIMPAVVHFQIPALLDNLFQRLLVLVQIRTGFAEIAQNLGFRQTVNAKFDLVQRGHKQQAADVLRVRKRIARLFRVSAVNGFRHGLSPLRYIMVDRVGKRRIDLVDKTERCGAVQIHVIDIHQIRRLRLSALIELADNLTHQADQAACLLEIRIFLETRIQVFDGGVERIAVLDTGEADGCGLIGQAGLIGLFQRVFECDGDLVYIVGISGRKAFKKAGPQNIVNFVRIQGDRFDI